jgi:preprotein translocase subunit SecE
VGSRGWLAKVGKNDMPELAADVEKETAKTPWPSAKWECISFVFVASTLIRNNFHTRHVPVTKR